MDWIRTRKKGPEWKQGWGDRTLSSISAPPLPLLAIFTIVIFLLSLSQYTRYREQVYYAAIHLKILLFLLPLVLMILLTSSMVRLSFRSSSKPGRELAGGVSGFPWGVAALLLLVSCHLCFQPKWFPFATN